MTTPDIRTKARVDMHLPGGFSRLILESSGNLPLEVKTEQLPTNARQLGSWVVAVFRYEQGPNDMPRLMSIDIEAEASES